LKAARLRDDLPGQGEQLRQVGILRGGDSQLDLFDAHPAKLPDDCTARFPAEADSRCLLAFAQGGVNDDGAV